MSTLNIDNQSTEFGNTKSKFTNLLNPPLKIKKIVIYKLILIMLILIIQI